MPRILLALVLTLAVACPLPAADWPQLLGPNRDGHSAETKLNWNWPKDGPPSAVEARRRARLGRAGRRRRAAHPLPPRRRRRGRAVPRPGDRQGECGSTATRTKYRDDFGFDDGPRATPTIAATGYSPSAPTATCTRSNSPPARSMWHRNVLATTTTRRKGFFGVACSPLVMGNRVLVNVGGKGGGRGRVRRRPTGKELWKATDDAASYSSPTAAEIDGKPAAVFLTRHGLRVLDSGERANRCTTSRGSRAINESVQAATPLVWKDEIFLTVSYATGGVLRLKEGQNAGRSLDERQVAVEPVHDAGSRGRLSVRHRRPLGLRQRSDALRGMEDGRGEVEREAISASRR